MVKRGKQIKDQIDNTFKISIGSVDAKQTKSAYVTISSWAEPIDELLCDHDEYLKVINKLHKDIRRVTYNSLSTKTNKTNRFIVNLDMRETGVSMGVSQFANCEITFLYSNIDHKLIELESELRDICRSVIDEVFMNNQYFKFQLNKR